ncbi:MAG: prolipoprotein diacylglyceryl transferase, partial [Clostridia bacterium]|nr:prolipoprotein diacylglyceryl transferase [Clostridia bacterium]
FDIVGSAVYAMIGAFLGSKLLFIIVSYEQIIEYQISLVGVIKGGFVFYGGLLGGTLGLFIYAKQFKIDFFRYSDIYATVLPVGHAIGRVGCFFAGCCYGIPHDGFLSYTYTFSVGMTPLGVPLLAIQLIEALLLFLLFLVLLSLILLQKRRVGFCTAVYVITYAVLRFILEFFRGDKGRGVFVLSTSQWISLLLAVLVLVILLQRGRKRKKEQDDTE